MFYLKGVLIEVDFGAIFDAFEGMKKIHHAIDHILLHIQIVPQAHEFVIFLGSIFHVNEIHFLSSGSINSRHLL